MISRLRTIPDWLLVALLATLYLYIFVRVQWRVGDEGDMLNGALAVAEGRVPYRDFFDIRGPASFYWLGSFFKIFGATWQVARLQLLLTGTLTSLLVYRLTTRISRAPGAVLPCALVTVLSIPLWAASHHHWDSNLFALAAVAAFCAWQDHQRMRWLIASGLLAGLTSCFIYQKGFLLLASFVAVTAISRLYFRSSLKLTMSIGVMLAGYGAVGICVLAWFVYHDALPDFFRDTISFPVDNYTDANRLPYAYHLMAHALGDVGRLRDLPSGLRELGGIIVMIPLLLIAALPLLVVGLAGLGLATKPAAQVIRLPVVTYSLTGFALWFSEFHRRDMMHLIYGSPLLLIALWLLWESLKLQRMARRLVPAFVGVALLVLGASRGLNAAAANVQVQTRRGMIVLPESDAALRFLLSDQVARGDFVFVYPYYPTYYFLADIRNPTRNGELMYGPGTKPLFDDAIAALEARKVKYILWDTMVAGDNLKEWFPAYKQPPENERWMELYFQAHYVQIDVLNGFRLLQRRDP